MKKTVILLIIIVLGTGCATHKAASSGTETSVGNMGESFEKAVVIQEKTESTGVAAEYKWIGKHYPGYKMIMQSLAYNDGKPYDIIKIKYKGKTMNIYFDISNYFGKF